MVARTRWRRRAVAGVAAASGGLLVSSLSSPFFTPTVQGAPSRPSPSPSVPTRKTVNFLIGSTHRVWHSRKATVEGALKEAGVKLGPEDEVFPDLDQPIWDGMPIFVCRVRTEVVARDHPIPYRTTYVPTKTRYRRLPIIQKPGKPGLLRKRYEVVYRDGQATEKRLIEKKVLREPVHQVITKPPTYQLASRGYYGGRRVFRMVATAYDPGRESCGPWADGITAIGMRAGKGVVAVDPRMIPMGARLHIEGYGYAVAGDIGGAIKGNRIDLGFQSRRQALQFGRRKVLVRVLD